MQLQRSVARQSVQTAIADPVVSGTVLIAAPHDRPRLIEGARSVALLNQYRRSRWTSKICLYIMFL